MRGNRLVTDLGQDVVKFREEGFRYQTIYNKLLVKKYIVGRIVQKYKKIGTAAKFLAYGPPSITAPRIDHAILSSTKLKTRLQDQKLTGNEGRLRPSNFCANCNELGMYVCILGGGLLLLEEPNAQIIHQIYCISSYLHRMTVAI